MVHIWQSASWCNDNFLSGLRLCDVGLVHGLLAWSELGWPVGFRSRYSPLVLAVCIHSLFSPLIGLFWLSSVSGLHLDHLCYCRYSFAGLGLCLHVCECMRRLSFAAHPGVSGV